MKLINKLDRYLEDKTYKLILKNNKLDVINYNEIIDFTSHNISIKCSNKIINIEGRNLVVSKMLDDEILICGDIINIRIN